MRISIDKADQLFSRYIRLRDKMCVRCKKSGYGQDGIEGLQNSHFFGRRKESVRFDVENCDSLCFGCHRIWETEDREAYRAFKIRQLGQDGFDRLTLRASQYSKKDRKLALLKAQALLKSLEQGNVPQTGESALNRR